MTGYWKDPSTLTATSGTVWLDPLTINGVALGDTEQLDPQVSVSPMGGATTHRLSDGSAARQTVWRKRRVRISGTGWKPPSLSAVDWSGPVTIAGQNLAEPVTGFSDGPEESFDQQRAEWRWTLTLEEA